MTSQPTLTDGTLTLRPWRDEDIERAAAGHDAEIDHWFGNTAPPSAEHQREVVDQWRARTERGGFASFVIDVDDAPAGVVEIRRLDEHSAELSWWLYAAYRGRGLATRAIQSVTDWAMTGADQGGWGLSRVQARVEPGNQSSLRTATRAGMRREGVQRVAEGTGDRADTTEYVVFARLASDPPLSEPGAFRALLNSFLPRKRAIGQLLIRDPDDRVLLCHLTYKRDWDLPGGVVEVGESPRLAVGREVEEELALTLPAGRLLVTDWLPPWGGWDDALCLVFDGGVHDPGIVEDALLQPREIAGIAWATPAEVEERCADFTARRIRAGLAAARDGGTRYAESGRG